MGGRYAIGVVGAGPKGTYALDHLATRLEPERPDAAVDVHVFEPHRDLGAGPVYDVRQPHYLRLNYANDQVDMWKGAASGPSLVEWLQSHHPDLASAHDSAPRAVVGEYLCEGFERIVSRLERIAAIHLHRSTVSQIRRGNGRWTITSVDDQPVAVDSLLITTGHESRRPRRTGLEGPNYIGSIYPIAESGLDRIAAGSGVAVRGLGLTAIDVALALTEGRGGRFDHSTAPIPTYRRSGNEPGVIAAYSRTGIPMTPKPWQVHATHVVAPAATIAQWCTDALRGAHEPVAALAAFLDEASSVPVADSTRAAAVDDPHRAVGHAVGVAFGTEPPTRDAALAEVWRGAYPSIVDAAVSRLFDEQWDELALLARRMERIAFGPPAVNAARFAALVEGGIVDLRAARNPRVSRTTSGFTLDTGIVTRRVDTLVNAVIAPPGVGGEPSPLFARLLDDGHVRRTGHGEGIDVDRDTRAIGRDGRPTPGLAVIGRMTDGATLGNDTLSRTLHDFPERWATTCVADIRRTSDDRRVTA